MADLYTFEVKDPNEIRDDFLRTLRAGLIVRGVTSPNVSPNSDFYVEAQALANEIAVIEANAVLKADANMPDTAVGADLERIAAVFGLSKRPAVGSTGTIVFDATADSLVTTGQQLVGPQGFIYEVTTGGTYADAATINIDAVSTGFDTNLDEGEALKWSSAPTYANPVAIVGTGGLVNGTNAEGDEELRQRLLAYIQNPPGGGNWSQTAQDAEDSTPAVQKGFVYPAIQGPATTHLVATASPTDTNKSRVVTAGTMSATVAPYVQGLLPEHVYSVVTSVTDVNTTVAIGLSLPNAPTASPPGIGGGWKDGTPWPSVDGTTYFKVAVTVVTSTSRFTCDARTAPTANVHRVAWISPVEWKLYTALVTSVYATTPGAVEVGLDTPFVGLVVGDLIWPQADNQQTYMDAVLAAFQLMGPGEKTANASAIVRGYRHPPPSLSWPATLGPHILRALEDSGDEVSSAQFLYRSDGTTSANGSTGVITPQVLLDAAVESAPNIYVPYRIGIYKSA